MTEIELGPFKYRIGTMDTMVQFHVARRVAPAVAAAGTSISEMAQRDGAPTSDDLLFGMLGPVSKVIAEMSDTEVNYVLNACLAVVSREQMDGRYAVVQRAGKLMFSDIDMPMMVRLAVEVLKENLGSFFPTLLGGSSTPNASEAVGAQSS